MTGPTVSLQLSPIDGGGLSLTARLLVTAGALFVLLVGVVIVREVRRRATDERRIRIVNAVGALGTFGLLVAVASVLVALWGQEPLVRDAFTFLGNPFGLIARAALSVGLFVGTYLLTGVVRGFINELTEDKAAISRHQTELIYRSTQVGMYILAIVIAFGVWDVNLGGLLVGAGFLGIVVGMAARQTLGALIAGFVLMFSRPFEIGDWVEIGDRNGIVSEITIVNTRIQTFDGEYVMIPNDVVSSSEIINRTRKGRLRIQVDVGVDYDTDLEQATETATAAMREVDEILTVPQPQVVLKDFGNSAITLGLRFWIDKPSARRKWRAQTAVIRAVKTAFDREGIKIPFPQRELMGRTEEGGFRLSGEGPPATDPNLVDEEVEAEPTPDGGERDSEP